jgi:hypothetical protein
MKTYLKYILIGLGIILGMVILVDVFTPKAVLIQDLRNAERNIKNLEKVNSDLVKKQIRIDSVSLIYVKKLDSIQKKLDSIQPNKIIIKKEHTEKINKSKEATPSETDSFFKSRYKY